MYAYRIFTHQSTVNYFVYYLIHYINFDFIHTEIEIPLDL